jgi:Fe-S cluster assembly scaffold protein SufB
VEREQRPAGERERVVAAFAAEAERAARASISVGLQAKAELKRADVTYETLAERLKEHGFGFEETKASISNKLARATMTAHFFLASLAAIGKNGLDLQEI